MRTRLRAYGFFMLSLWPPVSSGLETPFDFRNSLAPFVTDGCSGFISELPGSPGSSWLSCCVRHDFAYWRGGSEAERREADQTLRSCVAERGHPHVARAMYRAIRAGGARGLPTRWHWGYGWAFDRGPEALTEQERALIRSLYGDVEAKLDQVPISSAPIIPQRRSVSGNACVDLCLQDFAAGGRALRIQSQRERVEDGSEGRKLELTFETRDAGQIQCELRLLRRDACAIKQNELLARGRIQLRRLTPRPPPGNAPSRSRED